ncbi:MAG: transposase, partial [Beijerinckiaceae bacterium]
MLPIDSETFGTGKQKIKSSEAGRSRYQFRALNSPGRCIDPRGFDAGKKIKGKKRHILVDTQGLLMQAIVHPADI